jgi:hypothetical protein
LKFDECLHQPDCILVTSIHCFENNCTKSCNVDWVIRWWLILIEGITLQDKTPENKLKMTSAGTQKTETNSELSDLP